MSMYEDVKEVKEDVKEDVNEDVKNLWVKL